MCTRPPPSPHPSYPVLSALGWDGNPGLEQTFQRGKREAGALEQGVSVLLAGGSTGLGAGLGSSTSQRPDLLAKAMGDRGWGGACAGDAEGRSGAVGEVGRGLRRGWREGPRAGPTWPVAPSRSGSVPAALPRDSACALPGPGSGPAPCTTSPGVPGPPGCVRLGLPGLPPPSALRPLPGATGGRAGGPFQRDPGQDGAGLARPYPALGTAPVILAPVLLSKPTCLVMSPLDPAQPEASPSIVLFP